LNRKEFDLYLSDPGEFQRFDEVFGPHPNDWYKDHLSLNEEIWAAFCGIETEEEKRTRANLEGASAAKEAAESAKASAAHAADVNRLASEARRIANKTLWVSRLALAVSFVSFLVSLAAWFMPKQ
jgi:hypothetical protein